MFKDNEEELHKAIELSFERALGVPRLKILPINLMELPTVAMTKPRRSRVAIRDVYWLGNRIK